MSKAEWFERNYPDFTADDLTEDEIDELMSHTIIFAILAELVGKIRKLERQINELETTR